MSELSQKEQKHGGQILKETRESQGISLETVHLATKIPMDALKSIEEGYKVRTLTPFYIKGFMKIYAQYLGVDASKVLDDHHVERLPPHIPDNKGFLPIERVAYNFPKDKQRKAVVVIAVIISAFLVLKVGAVVFVGKAQKKKAAVPVAGDKDKKKASVVKAQTSVQQQGNKKVAEKVPVEKKGVVATPEPKVNKVKVPAVEEDDETEKPDVATKKLRLTIRAVKSGWLQVKVDGDLVFQSTLEQGASESWSATKEIELSGKNIHNLEFELNGKVLGGLGREDRSARRVIITESGLTVKNNL